MLIFPSGAGSSVTTAQPTSSITEAAVSESELSANRDEQQENQYMDVDDSLEPMVLLAPDGGRFRLRYDAYRQARGIIHSVALTLISNNI